MSRLSPAVTLTPDQRKTIHGLYKDKTVVVQLLNSERLTGFAFAAAAGEDRGTLLHPDGGCLGIGRQDLLDLPETRCEGCPGDGNGCPPRGCGREHYIERHTCPYKSEMLDDRKTLCRCDKEQTHHCFMEV